MPDRELCPGRSAVSLMNEAIRRLRRRVRDLQAELMRIENENDQLGAQAGKELPPVRDRHTAQRTSGQLGECSQGNTEILA